MKYDLSIIILSYNVCDLLIDCLQSIYDAQKKDDSWQIIVVDNNSPDQTIEEVSKKFPKVELVESDKNLGFSAGNNLGVKRADAKVILFLNPDTIINSTVIQRNYQTLISHREFGAISCKVELPDGSIDYSCHRGFPTPWNSFCYFCGLSKMFPHSQLFSGYTASYLNINKPHTIDCVTGAYLMIKKYAGNQIGWWDEDYFWNGEDIEFCYRLKEKGWKIYFDPSGKIIHYKGSSSGLWKSGKGNVSKQTRISSARSGVSAMRTFYLKHYYLRYPIFFRSIILWGIKALERYRLIKINWQYRTMS